MTIYDIAKEAGVAASTVSRVINDKPGIKQDTRDKVKELLKKYNYTPNEAARGLVMQSTKIIGILIEDIRVAHHTDSAYIIEQELTKLGYCCITMSTGSDDEKKAEYIKILEQRRVEGAILMGSMFETEAVKDSIGNHLSNIPIVMVNGVLDLPNVYGVVVDEKKGVKDCVDLLIGKGKRHLTFVLDQPSPSNYMKQQGFVESMIEHGYAREDILLLDADSSTLQGGYRATIKLLTDHPHVDGIVYSIDLIAVGGIRALYDMGLQVPGEVALTGIDGSLYGEICRPKLTTLDNKLTEMSMTASRILIDAIEGRECPHSTQLYSCIIEREST